MQTKKVTVPNKNNPQSHQENRRDFLQKSLMIGVGITSVAAIPVQVVASIEVAPELKPKKKKDGYQLSKHISDYYKSAQL